MLFQSTMASVSCKFQHDFTVKKEGGIIVRMLGIVLESMGISSFIEYSLKSESLLGDLG